MFRLFRRGHRSPRYTRPDIGAALVASMLTAYANGWTL